MPNGLPRSQAWGHMVNRVTDDETQQILHLVVNELDEMESRWSDRLTKMDSKMFWILTVLVGILVSMLGTLAAVAIR